MRIALVTEYYYPHLGGVTEHVHNLALQLQRMGHTPLVLTSNMHGQDKDEPFVHRLGTSVLIFTNGSFARFTIGQNLRRGIRDILRREHIDLVHLHGALMPTLGIAALSAARQMHIPVVATFHTWWPRSVAIRLLRGPLQQQMDAIAAKIAVSEPVVQANSRYFRAEWEIIPNGVNVGYFHPNGRVVTDAMTSGPRLLFLGRLDPRNGLATLLDAMPDILATLPTAELLVVGEGPLRPYYERRAGSLEGSIRFFGRILEDRPDYYGSSDLYLCPTTRASFGITLLEAMACGTPLVVSDIIGFRELVDGGDEAVLVSPVDPRAWARTIVELIEDPVRRERMRFAGLRKAMRFAWPRIAEKVVGVYQRVLN
jgi:phosphatidylinositol alpha-mannosyltransferase